MASSHPDGVPFPESAAFRVDPLSILLECDPESCHWVHSTQSGSSTPPQQSAQQLLTKLSPDKASAFLRAELATPLLDSLYQKLWLVARKESSHIDSIHHQHVKGRQVMLSEDPKMHLIWTPNKIFIKPIPHCLFSYHFWLFFLSPAISTEKAHENARFDRALALGFLRSYTHLIRHRSDFAIAKERHLLPVDVDWPSWRCFIAYFHHVPNPRVAQRYHYGQMRHSRLNYLVRLTLPRERSTFWFYEPLHWSTAPYMKGITTSVGFVLATTSVILSSMQVSLAAVTGSHTTAQVYWVFSVMVQSAMVASWILMASIPLAFVIWQLWWGFRHKGGLQS